jgi:hypothetical protein
MSTLTAYRQPPRIAVEIVRLLLKALVKSHKTADRGSMNRETRTTAIDVPATKLEVQGARNENTPSALTGDRYVSQADGKQRFRPAVAGGTQ